MIALGSDHAGFELKEYIKEHLTQKGYAVLDCGTYSKDSCDYPICARDTALKVASGECEKGIIICGSGIGVSISANKIEGVRAALCSEPVSAALSREHNDANVLCMGERLIGKLMAIEVVDAFLNASFDGGRHGRRVDQIKELDITKGK
jgi:ribose 5-phosphate isomerase B